MTASKTMRDAGRIGIYGGTFNPIHLGHLKAAREAADALDLDRILFVPSAQPPHKTHFDEDPIAPAEDRMHWVELAIADEPRFEVSDLELTRDGASYSVETIRTLVTSLAPARLVFILGDDAFVEMGTWREPEAIVDLVDIAVVSRPPAAPEQLFQCLPDFARERVEICDNGRSAANRESDTRIDLLSIDALDISASKIRGELAEGRSVAEWVPAAALDAIVSSGHYDGSPVVRDVRHHERGDPVETVEAPQRDKLVAIVEAALERSAQRPVILDVRELTSYTDYLVIVGGNSARQVRAITENVVKNLKARDDYPLGVEGGDEAIWMLIDANDVVVHVFEPDTRELFDIEGLWNDAPRVNLDLPGMEAENTQVQVPPRTA